MEIMCIEIMTGYTRFLSPQIRNVNSFDLLSKI